MKPKIFIAFFFLLSAHLYAQKSPQYFDYNGQDLNHFLQNKIRCSPSFRENCSMPFIYVKFRIKNNAVDSLSFSTEDKDLIDQLSNDFHFTKGLWNAKATAGKWLIVPIFFHLVYRETSAKGCDIAKSVDNQFGSIPLYKYPVNDRYVYFPPVILFCIGDPHSGVMY